MADTTTATENNNTVNEINFLDKVDGIFNQFNSQAKHLKLIQANVLLSAAGVVVAIISFNIASSTPESIYTAGCLALFSVTAILIGLLGIRQGMAIQNNKKKISIKSPLVVGYLGILLTVYFALSYYTELGFGIKALYKIMANSPIITIVFLAFMSINIFVKSLTTYDLLIVTINFFYKVIGFKSPAITTTADTTADTINIPVGEEELKDKVKPKTVTPSATPTPSATKLTTPIIIPSTEEISKTTPPVTDDEAYISNIIEELINEQLIMPSTTPPITPEEKVEEEEIQVTPVTTPIVTNSNFDTNKQYNSMHCVLDNVW